jgi:hypothetical protein
MMVSSLGFYNGTEAQGLPPAASPSVLSSPITGQSDIIPFSSGMLGDYMPTIPNLQLGFQYFFGDKVRSGQLNADYLLPYKLGASSVLFGEARGNYWNFGRQPTNGASNRVDMSLGGGYRNILADKLLVGVNGFYDTSRLFNKWYSSGSVGLEMAANVGNSDAFDLNANWYGDIFSSTYIINAFRNQGSSYDLEAGYSHALFDSQYDLRLKLAGYQFNTGTNVYGYKTGADLTTKNGMFTLRYEYGNDKLNGPWNNVGAFVNIGFQMENLIRGESPFTMPEPIFKSPRNLRRMLTQKVKRDWSQSHAPGRAALASAAVSNSVFCVDGSDVSGKSAETAQLAETVGYSRLDPNLYVSVTFDYTLVGGSSGLPIYVWVYSTPWGSAPGGSPSMTNSNPQRPVGSTGTLTVYLAQSGATEAPSGQQAFGGLDPNWFSISFQNYLSGTATNIKVCFNQVAP